MRSINRRQVTAFEDGVCRAHILTEGPDPPPPPHVQEIKQIRKENVVLTPELLSDGIFSCFEINL